MSAWKLLLAAIAPLTSQALSQVQKLSSLPPGAVHETDGRVWVPNAPSEDGYLTLQGPGGYGQYGLPQYGQYGPSQSWQSYPPQSGNYGPPQTGRPYGSSHSGQSGLPQTGYGQIGQYGLPQYGQYGPSQSWQSDSPQSGNYGPPQTGGSFGPPHSGQSELPQTGYNSYSLNSRYDPYPNYNYNPGYGSYPGYKSNPDYGAYPGYGSNPVYGFYSEYGSFRGCGSNPGYGCPPIKPYPFPFPFLQSTTSEAGTNGVLKPTLEDIIRFMVQMTPLKPVQVKSEDILGSTDPPAVPINEVSESGNPDFKLAKEGLLEETKSSGDVKEEPPEGDTEVSDKQ